MNRYWITDIKADNVAPGDKVRLKWDDENGHTAETEGKAYIDPDGDVAVGSIKLRHLGRPSGPYTRLKLVSVTRGNRLPQGSVAQVRAEHTDICREGRAFLVHPRRGTPYWITEYGETSTGANFTEFEIIDVRPEDCW